MHSKILLVDDDLITLSLHEALLRFINFNGEVLTFQDGDEVLEYLNNQNSNDCHYIFLLDINMPRVSGFEVLFELETLKHQHSFDVYMVSSSVDNHDKIRALNYDFVKDFIQKPLKTSNLHTIIKQANTIQAPHSPLN